MELKRFFIFVLFLKCLISLAMASNVSEEIDFLTYNLKNLEDKVAAIEDAGDIID